MDSNLFICTVFMDCVCESMRLRQSGFVILGQGASLCEIIRWKQTKQHFFLVNHGRANHGWLLISALFEVCSHNNKEARGSGSLDRDSTVGTIEQTALTLFCPYINQRKYVKTHQTL